MNSIKTIIKKRLKKFRRLYYIYRELRKLQEDRKHLWDEAIEKYNDEHPGHGSLSDYKLALFRHRFSYDEYMKCYKLWDLDEKHRDEFISEMEMRCIYRKTVEVSFDAICSNKVLLLKRFDGYVHRKWAYTGSMSFEDFDNYVSLNDCIAKPIFGTLGRGVFMIRKGEDQNWHELFDFCRKNNYMIEERLRACEEIESFHPQSLNTIRVFTISKKVVANWWLQSCVLVWVAILLIMLLLEELWQPLIWKQVLLLVMELIKQGRGIKHILILGRFSKALSFRIGKRWCIRARKCRLLCQKWFLRDGTFVYFRMVILK